MSSSAKSLMPAISSAVPTSVAHKALQESMGPLKETLTVKRLVDVLLFVGPSGCGKSTIIHKLQQEWPTLFEFSVSHTTRAPRRGEVNGQHYHFVTTKEFQQLVDAGAMVEHSCMHFQATPSTPSLKSSTPLPHNADGNLYGTSKKALHAVLERNRVVLMDTDLRGAINIRCYCARGVVSARGVTPLKTKRCPVQQSSGTAPVAQASPAASPSRLTPVSLGSGHSVVSIGEARSKGATSSSPSYAVHDVERTLRCMIIFIAPPSMKALEQRLRERKSETEASIQLRMRLNWKWMQWATENRSFFDYYIVNDDLEQCYAKVKSVVRSKVLTFESSL
ncbi:hypothetical protein JKF63_00221 [Porcisia hertigi]|uniref:Guanylate kinase-like domain-containing protein n=1 Tax=Porcisia hertigi TaxID=2761500 RepID=A0A836KY54_9TRYP|nr:hypothetical protein JKF63_00221 [Porcisia hertigi]